MQIRDSRGIQLSFSFNRNLLPYLFCGKSLICCQIDFELHALKFYDQRVRGIDRLLFEECFLDWMMKQVFGWCLAC
jgi:hypothetical protein